MWLSKYPFQLAAVFFLMSFGLVPVSKLGNEEQSGPVHSSASASEPVGTAQ